MLRILPALAALLALAAGDEAVGEEGSCQSDILLQAQHNRRSSLAEPVEESEVPPMEPDEREEAPVYGEEEELLETDFETQAKCDRVVQRFKELDKQDMSGGSDPLFPANMDSITAAGGECGDSAQDIKVACGKFNHWATFDKIAEVRNKKVDVMGKDVDYHDVAQGGLGTCYMLAAMASVAHSDPKAIQRMFVNREKWAKGVYTTRWMIDGRVGDVEVNNEIPAGTGTKPAPFFVRPGPDYESFWPVILEKAYAKIFGDFKTIEGGVWDNAVQAMTMAPVVQLGHKQEGKEAVWAALKEATANGWPMGCHTSGDAPKVGLATGHAYSTLNVSVHPKYGRVLTCFNPWNADYYKGVIPNSQNSDGVFTITLDEYMMAFGTSMFAKVEDDYELVSKKIVDGERSSLSAWEISITGNKVFWVTLSWPGWREVRPCQLHTPSFSLKVLRKDTKEVVATAPPRAGTFAITSVAAEVTAGAGDYIVVASLDFKEDNAIDGHLVVNSEKATVIKPSTFDPATLFVPTDESGNLCPVVTVSGTWLLSKDKKIGGVPVYESLNKKSLMFWYGPINQWAKLGMEQWANLKVGKNLGLRYGQHPKSELYCGCQDRATGVTAFGKAYITPCDQVRNDNAKHGWLKCTGVSYSGIAQEACPVTCGAAHCTAATPKPTPAPTPQPTPPPPAPQPVHPPAGCTDSTTYTDPTYGDNCAGWASYGCTGYDFSDKLIAACPKACKSCKHSPAPAPPPPPATCTDSTTYTDPTYGDDCAAWANYNCNGYDYSDALIAACPKACKTC